MISAVDTNVLLDILIPDERHGLESKTLIEGHKEKGKLIICEVVYAELASQFPASADLELFLRETAIHLVCSNTECLSVAGERWKAYAASRPHTLQCAACGKNVVVNCPECDTAVLCRQHVVSGFLIGAHALIHAHVLLSRDRGYYRTYFNDLEVVEAP